MDLSSYAGCSFLAEQVGQEILANLHSDREKIQRARERVSAHLTPAHTRASVLTSVRETVSRYGQHLPLLYGFSRKHTNESCLTQL